MSMKKTPYAPLFIVGAALLWSIDGLLRRNVYTLRPEVVVFVEHGIGAALLFPFVVSEMKAWARVRARTWLSVAAIALFGGVIGTVAYTAALGKVQYISLSVVVLLQQLQPVFAITLAALLLRERISKRFLILAGIAIVAAYAVTFPHLRVNITTGSGTVIAALLALVAALSWGSCTVLGRYALGSMSVFSLTAMRFWITTVIMFFLLLATGAIHAVSQIPAAQWGYVFAIVFSSGVVAMLIYYTGLAHVPARLATLLELCWPFSAIGIDWIVYGKVFTATQWAATLVLVGVMVVISRDYARKHIHAESMRLCTKHSPQP